MQNVADFNNTSDLFYIFAGILVFDIIIVMAARFFPNFWGTNLNLWYDYFGIYGVMCDVLSLFLGFIIARWIVTTFFKKQINNIWLFAIVLVAVQVIHDLVFYFGIVKPLPKNENSMINLFKKYGSEGGAKILVGDAMLMIGGLALALYYKNYVPDHTIELMALFSYALIYVLFTNWRKRMTA